MDNSSLSKALNRKSVKLYKSPAIGIKMIIFCCLNRSKNELITSTAKTGFKDTFPILAWLKSLEIIYAEKTKTTICDATVAMLTPTGPNKGINEMFTQKLTIVPKI